MARKSATKATGDVQKPSDAQLDAENGATLEEQRATPVLNADTAETLALAPSEGFQSEGFQCPTCMQLKHIEDRFVYQKASAKEFVRCVDCHRLMTRLHRAISKGGPDVKDEWHSLSPESRQKFYAENANKFGTELTSVLTETITECRVEKKKSQFSPGC